MKEKIASLKRKLQGGVSPAMATPLLPASYDVNIVVVPDLVDFLIEKGVKGLFVGGTTGEGIALESQERKKLLESAISAVNGRVPVLAHVGDIRVDKAVDLAHHASGSGADAIVAVPPYFYGMHDDGLAQYFSTIITAEPELPFFAYDIPHLAVNGVNPGLATRLANEFPSFAGCKSSSSDMLAVRRLIDALPQDRILLVGNESVALGSLALGADGMISGLSTAVPEPFVALTGAVFAGEIERARNIQRIINQLLGQIPAGERIGAIKSVLNERGVAVGKTVPTLPYPKQEIWPKMRPFLQ